MADVKFKQGFAHTGYNKSSGSNNVSSFLDALSVLAKCHHGGSDDCLGYYTFLNVTTGTLMAVYVSGTDESPSLVIEPLTDALATLQAAKDARG